MLSLDSGASDRGAVLHVDADEQARRAVEQFLRLELGNVQTLSVSDPESALEYVSSEAVGCVVSEYRCADLEGLDFLQRVRDTDGDVPFLFFSDVEAPLAPVRALNEGADGYLDKAETTRRYVRLAQRVDSLLGLHERRASLAATVRDFSRLFEQTDDVFWMYTADWEEVVFINSSYEEVWGQSISRLEADPQAFLAATHPDDREKVETAMERLSSGTSVELEFRVNPEADFGRWVWVEGAPITNENGNVEYVAGYVRDITDRRTRKQELERRTELLEQQAEQREFFNSVLRHDVLNGMGVIRGRSEYLVDQLDDETYREQAETVYEWAEEIIDVIDRIRAILQTIGEGEDRDLEPIPIRPIVDREVERVSSAYPDVTFDVAVPPETVVRGNELLTTVINNLLTNAVEHNETDGLVVRVAATRENEEFVHLRVADTGRGIPDDRKETAFDRGASSRAETERGGLGLYMVDTVVTTYGGAAWIEDNEPTGTVVCLALPTPESPEDEQA